MMNRARATLLLFAPLAAAGLAPASVLAQEDPPERVQSLVVYGNDPCPTTDDGSIVVCARKPESERYRIPKALRQKPVVSGGPGWGSQVANIDADARRYIPGSCSVIGAYGQTGCTAAMLSQWFAERRMQQQERAGIP